MHAQSTGRVKTLSVFKSIIAIIIVAALFVGVFYLFFEFGTQTDVSEGTVIINELMASNSSYFPDETGNYGDWIEIYNPTDTM